MLNRSFHDFRARSCRIEEKHKPVTVVADMSANTLIIEVTAFLQQIARGAHIGHFDPDMVHRSPLLVFVLKVGGRCVRKWRLGLGISNLCLAFPRIRREFQNEGS